MGGEFAAMGGYFGPMGFTPALVHHRGYVSFDSNIMGVGMTNRRLSTRKIKIGFKNSSWWLDMVGALQQFGEIFDFPFIRCWEKCRLIHFI